MKARLLSEKEVLEFQPGTRTPVAKPELVAQCVRRDGRLYAPAGTVLDDPDCFWLVLMGQAEAWDEECAARTKCSPEELAARLQAARRMAAGIHPDDYALFDAGEIAGYDGDGEYVPGPNWHAYLARQSASAATADSDDDV